MKKRVSYNKTGELGDILNDAMSNLKQAIDINTIVGNPILNDDGSTIIPVSKVYVGIVSGGGELNNNSHKNFNYPFAGGTGAGFTVSPIGFLITKNGQTTFVNTESNSSANKLIELTNNTLKTILENLKRN